MGKQVHGLKLDRMSVINQKPESVLTLSFLSSWESLSVCLLFPVAIFTHLELIPVKALAYVSFCQGQ